MAFLAILAGLFSGTVILVFRTSIDFILGQWLLTDGSESFEGLSYVERFALPVIGATLVGIMLTRLAVADRRVGVVHVMERLSRHQGYLPRRNAVVQFFGGIIALVSGQSGGREGPIPYVAFAGVVIGCIAAGFIILVQAFTRLSHWAFWLRALCAGTLTGFAAIVVPEVMGVGYDTVNGAMMGQIALGTLLLIIVLKTVTSAAAVGLGLPVGLIGPTFVIGAAVGGVLGYFGNYFQPTEATSVGFYVMLGMSAMMAAVLQAPLAALMAVMELTANPNVVLPAMVTIVVATLVTGVVFKQKSVFLSTMDTLGLQYPPDPVTLHLQRAGVASIMNRDLTRLPDLCSYAQACDALAGNPRWIVVETTPGDIRCVLSASDLMVYLNSLDDADSQSGESARREPEEERSSQGVAPPAAEQASAESTREVALLEIPGLRLDVVNIDLRATILEAQSTLREAAAEALCVRRISAPHIESVLGVSTQEDIDSYRETDP